MGATLVQNYIAAPSQIVNPITQTTNTGNTLAVYRNKPDTETDASMVKMHQDNSTDTQTMVELINDGPGYCLTATQNSTGQDAIWARMTAASASNACQGWHDHASSTGATFMSYHDGTGFCYEGRNSTGTATNYAYFVEGGASTTCSTAVFGRNISGATDDMVTITETHASNTKATLALEHNGDGPHIVFRGDPTNTTSSDGDMWFDGTNLKINIGGTVYNIDKTAA